MQRHGEDAGVALKNPCRAIALVHIQIDDRHGQGLAMAARPFGLHQPGTHGGVVEDTKTAALVGIGMVGATSQVGRQTFAQGAARGHHRGATRAAGPLDHAWRPGKADFALLCRTQAAADHRLDVSRGVDQGQLAIAHGFSQRQAQIG